MLFRVDLCRSLLGLQVPRVIDNAFKQTVEKVAPQKKTKLILNADTTECISADKMHRFDIKQRLLDDNDLLSLSRTIPCMH